MNYKPANREWYPSIYAVELNIDHTHLDTLELNIHKYHVFLCECFGILLLVSTIGFRSLSVCKLGASASNRSGWLLVELELFLEVRHESSQLDRFALTLLQFLKHLFCFSNYIWPCLFKLMLSNFTFRLASRSCSWSDWSLFCSSCRCISATFPSC